MRLKDKVAIVTGGAQGIGRGVVRRFAAEGASVLLVDLDVDRGTAAAAEVQGEGHQATFIQCDVSRADAVAGLFSRVQTEFGGIDILVNNAGLAHGPGAERHFLDMDEQMWDRVMATNLKSVYLCSWHAATMMKTRGRGGSIVNISSGGATRAHRHRVAYDASKGGIEAATRAMALDLAPWGIRVNAIAPGAIQVERRSPVGGESQIAPADVVPLGRLGTPEDVAGVAVFLASEDAAYLTGIVIPVDERHARAAAVSEGRRSYPPVNQHAVGRRRLCQAALDVIDPDGFALAPIPPEQFAERLNKRRNDASAFLDASADVRTQRPGAGCPVPAGDTRVVQDPDDALLRLAMLRQGVEGPDVCSHVIEDREAVQDNDEDVGRIEGLIILL